MSPDEDITQWIRQLQAGDREVVQKLWQGYFQRLVAFAQKKLAKMPRLGVENIQHQPPQPKEGSPLLVLPANIAAQDQAG